MTRGSEAIPPTDPGRNNRADRADFGPHEYVNGARRIEQGIASGQGTEALHEELNLIRQAAMQNGNFNLNQYKQDVHEIDKQLHADGFLPQVHIDVDNQGKDVVRRGSDQPPPHEAAPEAENGHRGGHHAGGRHSRGHHGRGHHGRGGHHRGGSRRGAESSPGGEQGENSPGTEAPAESMNENELRPAALDASRGANGDRSQDRPPDSGRDPNGDRSQGARQAPDYNPDPSKDRSNKAGGDLTLWGAPSISAAGIDKVLRENHSPAAGLGNYIYDSAVSRGINPAFALAMYGQESTFGTKGKAVRNNSFGNIKGRHGFNHYSDIKEGVDDWMSLMSNKYHGKGLSEVINTYAPSNDGNNPRSYMGYIHSNMSKWARMNDGDGDNQKRYA